MNFFRMIQSFKDAGRGIKYVFKHEQNFRLQFFCSILVILVSWFFHLRKSEWLVVLLLICLIMVLELLNSAVEKFADILKPRLDWQIQTAKDIMAGLVFVASFWAALIGLIIFYPYLIEFYKSWW